MKELEVQYKELLDNLYEGAFFVDTGLHIHYWNRAAEKITGYTAPEVLGKCCRDHMLETIEKLRAVSLLDPLTHLPNRRSLEIQLEACLQEVNRHDHAMGIMLFDIDNFKKINDTYGHNGGDRVLKMVARTAGANVRPFDVVGRWGGEEFVGILRYTESGGMHDIAERLRMLVEQSFVMIDREKVRATVSVGATLARHEDSVETAIKRADECMYKSKLSGKNRVTVDSSST